MPEIEVRPAIASDIPLLVALDHHYISDRVWQMELRSRDEASHDDEQVRMIYFRQVRLPRSVRVEYPRSPRSLANDWTSRSGILVAVLAGRPIGYTSLMLNIVPRTTWISDLVVDRPLRRQGIGSALMLAAFEWASNMATQNLVLEMQPKNHPAFQLSLKLGFEFCGYNDRYYNNREIGIFLGKSVH